jgi:hypothetical protein
MIMVGILALGAASLLPTVEASPICVLSGDICFDPDNNNLRNYICTESGRPEGGNCLVGPDGVECHYDTDEPYVCIISIRHDCDREYTYAVCV